MSKTLARRDCLPIKVYCRPEEYHEIQQQAKAAGVSSSTYLRCLGLNHEVHGILDYQAVQDLARVNSDLGRLGGLLKLWLSHDPRTSHFSPVLLRRLLKKIETTQDELRQLMKKIVRR